MVSIEEKLKNVSPETRKEMEEIWFTADLHHGHPKIVPICNRPVYFEPKMRDYFAELELKELETNPEFKIWMNREWKKEMSKIHDQWLVKEIFNKWVKPKYTVFILGDLSQAKKSIAEKFIDRLNGNKFLIPGNHDKNIHNSTRFSQIIQIKEFKFKRSDIHIEIDMCHYPLATWPSKPHGGWNLYAHVHGRFKNKDLSLDVGIDNAEIWWRPINLWEVAEIMAAKEKDLGVGVYYNNGID